MLLLLLLLCGIWIWFGWCVLGFWIRMMWIEVWNLVGLIQLKSLLSWIHIWEFWRFVLNCGVAGWDCLNWDNVATCEVLELVCFMEIMMLYRIKFDSWKGKRNVDFYGVVAAMFLFFWVLMRKNVCAVHLQIIYKISHYCF